MAASSKKPPQYKTNGCTAAPDLDFRHCCDKHDVAYQQGGGWVARLVADWRLGRCIRCESRVRGRFLIGFIYFFAVRIFGPIFFAYWWGRNLNGWAREIIGTLIVSVLFTIGAALLLWLYG